MKDKNSKDNLEDLFRNLFNDSRRIHEPEGWNVPSEDDWDSIQKGLGKEKKEDKKFLYWHWVGIAASVLLILSVFQLYQSNQKIQHLSKRLIENDKAVQKIQAELQALNNQKGIKLSDAKNEQLGKPKYSQATLNASVQTEKMRRSITKETTVFNNVNAANKVIVSKPADHSSPNFLLGEATLKANLALISVDKKEQSSQNNDLNTSILQKESTLNTIFISDKLPTATTPLALKSRTINWTSSTITPIIKKRPRFYVAVNYSPVLTTVKDKGAKLDKNEFFPRRETQKTAYSTGLQFGVKWDKGWSLETGLHYSSIKKLIRHNRIIPYQSLQERLNRNGDFESNINLQLGSAEGAVDTDISLARSAASTVASDANINMDIAFTSDRNYLDIPLIVKKEWAIGSFALSLKAGLLNRFLLNKSFELQQIILDDGRFISTTNNFRERPTPKSSTRYAAHYLAGFGLAYTFRPGLSFYLEPTFIRSMQPVISPRGASIYTKSKMLNVGFRYLL